MGRDYLSVKPRTGCRRLVHQDFGPLAEAVGCKCDGEAPLAECLYIYL